MKHLHQIPLKFVIVLFLIGFAATKNLSVDAAGQSAFYAIRRVSVANDGTQADKSSFPTGLSENGRYIVFQSQSTNLTPDTNLNDDVFVFDQKTSTIEKISMIGNAANSVGVISADGQFIVYESRGPVGPGIYATPQSDIFLYDRSTGHTTLISKSILNEKANGDSRYPSISADGSLIAFESYASNLVGDDTNNIEDVFIYNRTTQAMTRISVAGDGTQANGHAGGNVKISDDGSTVAFYSIASNLVLNDTNNKVDLFVHDLTNGTTERVSVSSSGRESNATYGGYVEISANGNLVVFSSDATNLIENDTNQTNDIFLHNRITGETTRLSVTSSGTQSNGNSDFPSISADGQRIVFQSAATNLISDDTNGATDIFLLDLKTNALQRLSTTLDGTQGNKESKMPLLSADGSQVAFGSAASNLIEGDTNNVADSFVVRLDPLIWKAFVPLTVVGAN